MEPPQAEAPIRLKALRSVSADLLKSNKEYAHFADLFLGHAPSKMGEKHYYTYGQEHFDEAVMWLRGQFFPLDAPPSDPIHPNTGRRSR
jgi:hypothetical protein